MKTETLLVLLAVGAVVYFATRQPAPSAPVVVQRGESTAQTAIKAGVGLAGSIVDLFRDSGANQQSSVSG